MAEPFQLDGLTSQDLARLLELPEVELLETTTSTLDVAHRRADAGASAGTLVIADQQTAGRGRSGGRWSSPSGSGLWLTLIERPRDASGLEVLSLRTGLRAARALDRFAEEPVRLKWPNDLYVDEKKLGGILIEVRWREQRLEWIAVGIGINVQAPIDVSMSAGLDSGTQRVEVLVDLVPALRGAATASGELTAIELIEWNARDLARGRHCLEPARGTVEGISPAGELLVALADSVARFRSGSLVLEDLQ